jgi:thioesterase domain-containing protein
MQARGTDGAGIPHTSVEAAAEFYIKVLMSQSSPPDKVHLIGHSFGGWIVFDMALKLREIGVQVASLTLIDSEVPGGVGVLGQEYTRTEVLMVMIKGYELRLNTSLNIERKQLHNQEEETQLLILHRALVRVGLMPPSSPANRLLGIVRTFETALRTQYQPTKSYPDSINLVLLSDTLHQKIEDEEIEKIVAGWGEFAPKLGYWQGTGNHFTALEQPYVRDLGQWLNLTLIESIKKGYNITGAVKK